MTPVAKPTNLFLMIDFHFDTSCEKLSPIECDVCPAIVRNYKDIVPHFLNTKLEKQEDALFVCENVLAI